jgi:hypothetical protein
MMNLLPARWSTLLFCFLFCLFFFQLLAAEVEKHLANEQVRAATKIQATWKGYRIRRGLDGKREARRRLKAAVIVQRQVRNSGRRELVD